MEANEINTDDLKYDILDALRDLITLSPNVEYKERIKSLILQLRKCIIISEDTYASQIHIS